MLTDATDAVTSDVATLLSNGTIGTNGTAILGDITTQVAAIVAVATSLINTGSLMVNAMGGTQPDNR